MSSSFVWMDPPLAHVAWESRPWIQRILRWVGNVSRGQDDRRQVLSAAHFIDGATLGRAKK